MRVLFCIALAAAVGCTPPEPSGQAEPPPDRPEVWGAEHSAYALTVTQLHDDGPAVRHSLMQVRGADVTCKDVQQYWQASVETERALDEARDALWAARDAGELTLLEVRQALCEAEGESLVDLAAHPGWQVGGATWIQIRLTRFSGSDHQHAPAAGRYRVGDDYPWPGPSEPFVMTEPLAEVDVWDYREDWFDVRADSLDCDARGGPEEDLESLFDVIDPYHLSAGVLDIYTHHDSFDVELSGGRLNDNGDNDPAGDLLLADRFVPCEVEVDRR